MPTIKLRHTTQTGVSPGSLADGEVAINLADAQLFYRKFVAGGNSVVSDFVQDYLAGNEYVIDCGLAPSAPPEGVENISVTTGNRQVTVSWTARFSEEPILYYTVRLTNQTTFAQTLHNTTGFPAPTTLTITGLDNGVNYAVSVKAVSAAGESAFISPIGVNSHTPSAGPPVTFTNAQLRSDNTGSGYTDSEYRFEDTGGEVLVTFAVAGTLTFTFYDDGDGDTDYDIFPENHAGISGPHYNSLTGA